MGSRGDAPPQEALEPCADGVVSPVVPPMAADIGKLCFVVHGLLTAAECHSLLEQAEAQEWHPADLEYGLDSGDRASEAFVNVRLRDSDRSIVHNDVLATSLWKRLQPLIPLATFEPLRPVRVNSCFRCLRYSEGQAGFAKHVDGRCVVGGELSKVTVQLYLNEGFVGGATRLWVMDDAEDAARGVDVMPRTGMVFVFDQSILHSGRPVQR